jgi:hypothetical protein
MNSARNTARPAASVRQYENWVNPPSWRDTQVATSVKRKQAGLTQFSDQRVAVCGDNATAESACGAYVEADIGIDQRLLCSGDAVDDQRGVEGCTSLDQP